jgi:hypothetical protein
VAVFSLPLQVGVIRLGTLDLHRCTTGRLSVEQLADALALRAGSPGWLPDVHADVHIASGMVSAQQGIDVRAALLRIRGYAFAHDQPIQQVARHIIDRDLALGRAEDNGSGHGPTAPDKEGEL